MRKGFLTPNSQISGYAARLVDGVVGRDAVSLEGVKRFAAPCRAARVDLGVLAGIPAAAVAETE
jgi:hypothetical protein